MTTKKVAGKRSAVKKRAAGKDSEQAPASMPKGGRDPRGGLTAKGREYFNKKEGSHLRPGVQGPADTPEKMVRKGSFLRRHFAHPRGPMKNDKGEPTRLALSAHAWGEPVPDTTADAAKLAEEGHELLEHYHALKDGQAQPPSGSGRRAAGKKVAGKKTAAKKTAAKKAAAKKPTSKKLAGKPAKKSAGKKAAAKGTPASRSGAKGSPQKIASGRGRRS